MEQVFVDDDDDDETVLVIGMEQSAADANDDERPEFPFALTTPTGASGAVVDDDTSRNMPQQQQHESTSVSSSIYYSTTLSTATPPFQNPPCTPPCFFQTQPLQSPQSSSPSKPCLEYTTTPLTALSTTSTTTTTLPPPPLTASLTSSSASLLGDSNLLDAAASLLCFPNRNHNESFQQEPPSYALPMRVTTTTATTAPTTLQVQRTSIRTNNNNNTTTDATECSQFVPAAAIHAEPTPSNSQLLAVLPEDTPLVMTQDTTGPNRRCLSLSDTDAWQTVVPPPPQQQGTYQPPLPLTNAEHDNDTTQYLCQTILPAVTQSPSSLSNTMWDMTVQRMSDKSFSIAFDVSVASADTMANRLVQFWRKPATLTAWCNLVPASAHIWITRSMGTEGQGTQHNIHSNRTTTTTTEQYDGEWIQATTAATLQPPSPCVAWCHATTHAALWALGCAPYTHIALFVEPRTVSITLGPLPGNMCMEMQLHVHVTSPHTWRITNQVQLVLPSHHHPTHNHDDDASSPWCTPSWWWWTPRTAAYQEQMVQSMIRLRALCTTLSSSSPASW